MTVDEAHTVSRAECLERYREKKLRRLDVNTIRYMKRKINADRRPRESASHDRQPPVLTDLRTGSCTMQHVTAVLLLFRPYCKHCAHSNQSEV